MKNILIEKFSDFEHVSVGGSIDEGVLDSIKNYFSRALGGKVKKIDRVLDRYKEGEAEYWSEWAKAKTGYNQADLIARSLRYDAVERQKQEELKDRYEKQLAQLDDSRKLRNDALDRQGQSLASGNARLTEYYAMAKAKADEAAAKMSYDAAKKQADEQTVSLLYDKVRKATDAAKRADDKVRGQYGNEGIFGFGYGGTYGGGHPHGTHTDFIHRITANIEEVDMSFDEYKETIKDKTKSEMEGIYKVLERTIKGLKEKRDAEVKRMHADKTDTRATADADRFERDMDVIISDLEKKADYLFRTINIKHSPTAELKKDLVENPKVVTDVTPKEVPVDKAVAAAVDKTAERVDDPTPKAVVQDIQQSMDEWFDAGKDQIIDFAGEDISDDHYANLKKDLIKLFGMLTFFYKNETGSTPRSKTMKYSLLAFAGDLYQYKKEHDALDRVLTTQELNKKFEEFEK